MILDSHCHLDMPEFNPDRTEVIRRAVDAGLGRIVSIATAVPGGKSIENTIELAERYDLLYAGVGIHPHDARLADDRLLQAVESALRHPKVILWGEIGLDYYYDSSPREDQRRIFRIQLQMARRRSIPVSIHCRDAWGDLISILKEEWSGADSGGILHSFTGTTEQALECLGLGFWVSFSGIVTFKNAAALRAAARALPLDRILVETDCPYLAPPPHRGKRNEPAFVVHVAESLARELSIPYEDFAARVVRNFSILTGAGGK